MENRRWKWFALFAVAALGVREDVGLEDFDDWESTGPLAKDETFRRRYQLIILWPGGDPPGESRDRALADSLAHDAHFTARPGFDPFLVYVRR